MSDAEPTPQPPAAKRRFSRWLFVLFVLLLAAVATGGWLGWRVAWMQLQAQNTKVETLRNGLRRTNQELTKLREAATGTSSSLLQQSGQLGTLRHDVNGIRHNVGHLEGLLKGGRRRVEVAEIAQLLGTANRSIELNGNPATARIALREADRLLSSLGSPRFFPVQKVIASELVALQAVRKPDITTAALELSQLINQIPQLPIQNRARLAPQTSSGPTKTGSTTDESWASRSWGHIKQALSALFRVRRSAHTIAPMLTAAQESLVAEVLSLRLDTARAALIRRDQVTFDAVLRSASTWLGRYYDPKNAGVSAMQDEIAKLEKLELSPKLPSVGRSLELFRQIEQGSAADDKNG